jgi:hypothetical protein
VVQEARLDERLSRAVNRPRRQSPAVHRVVRVRTGLLSQLRAGEEWRRAQRGKALINLLSAIIGPGITGGSGSSFGRAAVAGSESAKAPVTGIAQSRARSYRISLSASGGRKVAARALCETINQPQTAETGRRPGTLRQQLNSDHRQMRRPLDHRVVQSSGPPSCSRRSSQLGFVMKTAVGNG